MAQLYKTKEVDIIKETITAKAEKLSDGFQVKVGSRSFKFLLDEPENLGGTDKGMSPMEAVLCALGGCQTICAFTFAKDQSINLKDFFVELEGDLDTDGFLGKNPNVRNGFSEIRFTMHFNTDDSKDRLEKFADYIESHCPVGDSLNNGVPLIRTGVIVE